MLEIRYIQPRSFAKIFTILSVACYLAVGLLFAILVLVLRSLLSLTFLSSSQSALTFFLLWLSGTVVVIVAAYLLGLFLASVYNATTRWWGGLRLDLFKSDERNKSQNSRRPSSPHQ